MNKALDQARSNVPTIILSEGVSPLDLLRISYDGLSQNEVDWHELFSYPHVAVVDFVMAINNISLVREVVVLAQERRARPDDPLARRIPVIVEELANDALGVIRHDLGHARRARAGSELRTVLDARWIPLAKQLFGNTLTRRQLIARVSKAARDQTVIQSLTGYAFPDILVDIEGTLLDEWFDFQKGVFEMIHEESKTRPVTLATGGDVNTLRNKVRVAGFHGSFVGVPWKVLPKGVLRGARFPVVVDNMPQEEFDREYGILYDEYRKV